MRTVKDEEPQKKYPRGHFRERERILKELKRVYIEIDTKNSLRRLDHAYKKIISMQKGNMLPWIDIPVIPNSTLPTKKKQTKT